MKRGFTLVEMIVVIVILGFLSAGTFVSLKHLYLRVAKSKALSELSTDSQIVVNQISSLLYERVPSSVIGYDGNSSFESIYSLNSTYKIIEWIGLSIESLKKRDYNGFVDLDDSNATSNTLSTPDSDLSLLQEVMKDKFGIPNTVNIFDNNLTALVFAGTFDDGNIVYSNEFNSTFGWHENIANKVFEINATSNANNIILKRKPNEIYEKYYIVDSAYAIARGIDVNISTCGDFSVITDDNTLFLFYDYRPWKKETFCADLGNSGNRAGKATILSNEVSSFEIDLLNSSISFNINMQRVIKGSENNVSISKQKVVF